MNIHGKVICSWIDDILFVEAIGPFNNEGVINAAKLYLNTIQNRKFSKFFVVEIWDEESLGSPSSYKDVSKMWNALNDNGCIAFALVVSSNIQQLIARQIIPDIGEIFFNKEEAVKWISQKK
ncbi:MAG: hypothetical protein OQL19_11535 [Gammaproteobacteria bacterium]|nr:hypothetical protein [Gammaproteobacteria bacterium]